MNNTNLQIVESLKFKITLIVDCLSVHRQEEGQLTTLQPKMLRKICLNDNFRWRCCLIISQCTHFKGHTIMLIKLLIPHTLGVSDLPFV